jgi:hypothetical protein
MMLNEPSGIPIFYGANVVAQWCGVGHNDIMNWTRRNADIPIPAGKVMGPVRYSYFWREDQRDEWLNWVESHDVHYRPQE